jgi:hypothetical protein
MAISKSSNGYQNLCKVRDGAQPIKQQDAGDHSQILRGFTALDTEEAL